jgi:3-methyladenine DNA glycosylase AlkD
MARKKASATDIRRTLRLHASGAKAKILQRFFKTGPGQYGEGDCFLGIVVPDIRRTAVKYRGAPDAAVLKLLASEYHEERLLALLIFVLQFPQADIPRRKQLYTYYLDNIRFINNWDLVDLSAPHIVGAWLMDKDRKPLLRLARSRDLWKRRIAVLASFAFIRENDFRDALAISKMLLRDEHDLIHKSVGWMLREIGKRSVAAEEQFLKRHYKTMPRTMLRYAIERFPETKRKRYLEGKV